MENKNIFHKREIEKYLCCWSEKNISPDSCGELRTGVAGKMLHIRYNIARRIWCYDWDCKLHCVICWDVSILHHLASCWTHPVPQMCVEKIFGDLENIFSLTEKFNIYQFVSVSLPNDTYFTEIKFRSQTCEKKYFVGEYHDLCLAIHVDFSNIFKALFVCQLRKERRVTNDVSMNKCYGITQ